MRRLALLPALMLALAACGGSDDPAGSSAPATTVTTAAADTTSAGDPEVAATTGEQIAAVASTVSVHYTGSLDDGTQFDSSVGGDPIQFTIGAGEMIAGFDAAVLGMAVGETKTVRFGPEEGYGEYQTGNTMEVPLSDLPPEGVEVSQQLVSGDGTLVVVVLEVGEETAVLDFNHHLTGEYLTFEITLVSIDS